ncbi:conserved protein of unknown function [Shewanella benthica]|uniref:Uncharacterized protein n=1 Tax=Shewanella benthica TaxID=43661 RepID=A0A330M444_9GAMM|nr:hypothetical protein [Shewanella benthica]SQH74467.1 conserved protein of unknown function [Shewanella benthica]
MMHLITPTQEDARFQSQLIIDTDEGNRSMMTTSQMMPFKASKQDAHFQCQLIDTDEGNRSMMHLITPTQDDARFQSQLIGTDEGIAA